MVGFHWFEWFDEPAVGRIPDGENSNYGVVNGTNQVYTMLTNQMTITNKQLAAIHESSPSGLKVQCVNALTCLNDCFNSGCCDTDTGSCNCDAGFSGDDCSIDNSRLSVTSFGSSLNTSVWSTTNGDGWGSQYFQSGQVKEDEEVVAWSMCTLEGPAISPAEAEKKNKSQQEVNQIRVIHLHLDCGLTGAQIMRLTGLKKTFAYKWVGHAKVGASYQDLPQSGQPQHLRWADWKKICKMIQKQRGMSTQKAAAIMEFAASSSMKGPSMLRTTKT